MVSALGATFVEKEKRLLSKASGKLTHGWVGAQGQSSGLVASDLRRGLVSETFLSRAAACIFCCHCSSLGCPCLGVPGPGIRHEP